MLPVDAATLPEAAAPVVSTTVPRITAPPLVDARWLLEHRAAVQVIDTRPASAHAAGHVPGSRSLPLDALLVDDTSRPALERLARAAQHALAARGIAADKHVVLIDDADGSAALGAAICELAGMRRVSAVVGSGMDGWITAGGAMASGDDAAAPVTAWQDVAPRTGMVAAFEDLVDAVVDGSARVVDARSQLEHEGIVGAPCCAGRGAIPGSVHLEWTAFFDMAGHVRASDHVREIAAHVGLDPDHPIVVTCHAGHRAAIATRVLRSAGFRDVRLSLGSGHEWSARGLGADLDEDSAAAEADR
jgi:3-mercaptopyruvate sulfurtransferase SseA